MKTWARITGVLLIVFGLSIVLSAIAFGILGGIRDALQFAGSMPTGRGLGLAGLLLLLFYLGNGLLVTGMGQGLYLLTNPSSARG